MHRSETKSFLRANDCQANPETRVIMELMRDTGLIHSELEHQRGIDTTYVITIQGVILNEKIPKLDGTLEDFLDHDRVDLMLAQEVLKDVVQGMILLHTDIIFHCDVKPQSIVQCGSS